MSGKSYSIREACMQGKTQARADLLSSPLEKGEDKPSSS